MIYFDNAATSFPKPPQVARAMAGTLEKLGANPGRRRAPAVPVRGACRQRLPRGSRAAARHGAA